MLAITANLGLGSGKNRQAGRNPGEQKTNQLSSRQIGSSPWFSLQFHILSVIFPDYVDLKPSISTDALLTSTEAL